MHLVKEATPEIDAWWAGLKRLPIAQRRQMLLRGPSYAPLQFIIHGHREVLEDAATAVGTKVTTVQKIAQRNAASAQAVVEKKVEEVKRLV